MRKLQKTSRQLCLSWQKEKQKNRGSLDSWGAVAVRIVVPLPFFSASALQFLHTFCYKTSCLSFCPFKTFLQFLSTFSLSFYKAKSLHFWSQNSNIFSKCTVGQAMLLFDSGKTKKLLQIWHLCSTGLTIVL